MRRLAALALLPGALSPAGCGRDVPAPRPPGPHAPPEDCEQPTGAAFRLLLFPEGSELELERVLASEAGCVVAASGRPGALRWTAAWSGPAPEEWRGRLGGLSADGSAAASSTRTADGSWMGWWRSDGRGFTSLGRLPGVEGTRALALSGDGRVVAGVSAGRAVRWDAARGLQPLAPDASSAATAVSADGRVLAGWSRNAHGNDEAVRWVDGRPEGLGDLPGGIFASRAEALSPDGVAVAGRSSAGAGRNAFLWTAEGGLEELACPQGTDCEAQVLAVADGGAVIAGCASLSEGLRAVIWTRDGSVGLVAERLAAAGSAPPAAWTLTCATDVSADGRVLAGTARSSDGRASGCR